MLAGEVEKNLGDSLSDLACRALAHGKTVQAVEVGGSVAEAEARTNVWMIRQLIEPRGEVEHDEVRSVADKADDVDLAGHDELAEAVLAVEVVRPLGVLDETEALLRVLGDWEHADPAADLLATDAADVADVEHLLDPAVLEIRLRNSRVGLERKIGVARWINEPWQRLLEVRMLLRVVDGKSADRVEVDSAADVFAVQLVGGSVNRRRRHDVAHARDEVTTRAQEL